MTYTSDRHTTYAVIDLNALAHNIAAFKRHVGPDVAVFGVVKANAYGHGAVQCAHTLLENGATYLAIARVDEAIQLRRAGITAPTLLMSYAVPREAPLIAEHDIIPTVNTLAFARAFSDCAQELGKQLPVHVKVDTGMGRYGQLPSEVLPFLSELKELPGIYLHGIYTHFATADEADTTYFHVQLAKFKEVRQTVIAQGYSVKLWHAANSAATMAHPEAHFDAVRPGVSLYGMYPSDELVWPFELKPVLTFKSHVGRVRTLPPGSGVSYGKTYTTTTDTPVALIPVGYGDGYSRLLSNKGRVLIHGKYAPIIRRVCMDQFVVDVTGIDAEQDDEVVLIGKQGAAEISADEIARMLGTINYEVTTALLPRIVRIFVKSGEVVDVVAVATE